MIPFRSDASAPDPCGTGQPHYLGHDPYSFGYGIHPPDWPWRFPHGMGRPRRLDGLALKRVTNLGVRLLLLSGIRPDPFHMCFKKRGTGGNRCPQPPLHRLPPFRSDATSPDPCGLYKDAPFPLLPCR